MEFFFHPRLVHLPLGLATVMPLVVAVTLWAAIRLSPRVWIVAALFQAILVAGGGVAMRTGEVEKERVEVLVPHAAVEAHEEAAEGFVWTAAGVLAILVGAALLPRRHAILGGVALAGTLVVLALAIRVGVAGGALVYQYGAASAYAGPPSPRPDHD